MLLIVPREYRLIAVIVGEPAPPLDWRRLNGGKALFASLIGETVEAGLKAPPPPSRVPLPTDDRELLDGLPRTVGRGAGSPDAKEMPSVSREGGDEKGAGIGG